MQRGGRGNRNGMANQGNMVVARSLHATMLVLAQADHDYQGHRVLAMRHVQTAIHQLLPVAARAARETRWGCVNGQRRPDRRQWQSQSQRQWGWSSRQEPHAAGNVGPAPSAGIAIAHRHPQSHRDNGSTPNHARAATAIQNAVRELNIALEHSLNVMLPAAISCDPTWPDEPETCPRVQSHRASLPGGNGSGNRYKGSSPSISLRSRTVLNRCRATCRADEFRAVQDDRLPRDGGQRIKRSQLRQAGAEREKSR